MPDDKNWSIEIGNAVEFDEQLKDIKFPNNIRKYAMNNRLAGKELEKIDGNVVLFVENSNGGFVSSTDEMISHIYEVEKYCILDSSRCAVILFVDGTVGFYRPFDGKISLNKEKGYLSHFVSDTEYLPLRWE
ncbi:MAG: hypothetical protein JEZ07_16280 [Phycisphaerae bacterium]|nr:hypothetical protein [Phycisphaerae bacterium]